MTLLKIKFPICFQSFHTKNEDFPADKSLHVAVDASLFLFQVINDTNSRHCQTNKMPGFKI